MSIPILLIALLVATQISTLGFQTAGIYALIGFVGGFGVQFIGHAVEGKTGLNCLQSCSCCGVFTFCL
ncbi:MAG: hypothetical protein R2728_06950 [Chitinophagales bacterium]